MQTMPELPLNWELFRLFAPIGISALVLIASAFALFMSLHDRRPRIRLRERVGEWFTLQTTSVGHIMFAGVVEIYNLSSRATAPISLPSSPPLHSQRINY